MLKRFNLLAFAALVLTSLLLTLPQQSHAEGGLGGLFNNIGSSLGIGGNQNSFIPPDQAFRLTLDIENPGTLKARWEIEEGYYLYRERFFFRMVDSPENSNSGVTIGAVNPPPGKKKYDEAYGDTEVYYEGVEILVPLIRSSAEATTITIEVEYQGCAEIGFCYPPEKKQIPVNLPKAEAAGGSGETSSGASVGGGTYVSEQGELAAMLAGDNIALTLLTFFGLGLLLTFTPCVFPMIPILSGIIAGQGNSITTRKAFLLSLTYVLAMSFTYTMVGLLASSFNLQAAMQAPWVLITFSIVFVLLSLSMFGFYELQMPSSWQSKLNDLSNKQQGGTLFGVAIMGFLSALIVGPCVAAPLAGALIYISQTGDQVLGGMALFSLSMGMGVPLLLIGTSAGKLLPKAGPWMHAVKSIFGVMLLAVAIWLLERILPGTVTMALWATLLIISAIYLGALTHLQPEASGWAKLWKGVGIIMLIYGSILVIGAAGGSSDPLQPLGKFSLAQQPGGAQAAQAQKLPFKPIKSLRDLENEVKQASANGQYVMLDFYADWCISCKEMEKYTFSDPGVRDMLNNVVLLKADVTANDDIDKQLMKNFGIFGPPSILFFNADQQELERFRLMGFLDAEAFKRHLQATLI